MDNMTVIAGSISASSRPDITRPTQPTILSSIGTGTFKSPSF
jgi:hypothetical protein